MIQFFTFILKWIQQNKLAYLFFVAVVLCVVELIKSHIMEQGSYTVESPAKSVKKKKWIRRVVVYFVAAIIPTAISIYYPLNINDPITIMPDGYIKLMFYDGKFAYHDYAGQNVYSEEDIVSPRDRSFFEDSIAPVAYITIVDTSNQVIFDGKSEHMESCLVPIKYGEYRVIVSCDNYQKYEIGVSLTPYNKNADIWIHKVYLIPKSYIATDIQIQAISATGVPYSNLEISIGYPGYSLTTFTNENGIVNSLYILAKGEYLLFIEEIGVAGRFMINELTEDYSTIVVTLE